MRFVCKLDNEQPQALSKCLRYRGIDLQLSFELPVLQATSAMHTVADKYGVAVSRRQHSRCINLRRTGLFLK